MEKNSPQPSKRQSSALQPWFEAFELAAANQSGVASRAQLIEAGFRPRRITDWKGRGLLVEQARDVFMLRGTTVGRRGLLWAGLLSTGGDAAVTGPQSFDALDLLRQPATPVHIVATHQRRRQPGVVLRRAKSLVPEDVLTVDGLRCTAFARTLVDRAPMLSDLTMDQLCNRAVQLRLFNLDDFDRLTATWPRAPSLSRVHAAIDRLDETADRNHQELERRLIRLIADSDIPMPAVNCRIGKWELDVHWIGTRAVVEADGDRYHSSPAQIARDIEKQKALEAMGFVIRRFDWIAVNYRQSETLTAVERFRVANLAPPVPGPPPE